MGSYISHRKFLFYKQLCEVSITKYKENRPLQNGIFLYKLTKFEKIDSQTRPNLFILVDSKVIQKLYVGILKIFHFFRFYCGPKFQILSKIAKMQNFWLQHPIKLKKKEKFKNPRIQFWYHLGIYQYEQIMARSDRNFSQIWSIYAKMVIFFQKGRFSLYFVIRHSHSCL